MLHSIIYLVSHWKKRKNLFVLIFFVFLLQNEVLVFGNESILGNNLTKNNSKPTVTTSSITGINTNSAKCSGSVSNEGSAPVTDKGICWGKTNNPTISHQKISAGAGKGYFQLVLNNLEPNTTYYVRAYAINNSGVSYGTSRSFKTKSLGGTGGNTQSNTINISTKSVISITSTSATCGGFITNSTNNEIEEMGVCWSENTTPQPFHNKIIPHSKSNSFTVTIDNLLPNKNYYCRAYVVHNSTYYFGEIRKFKTLTTNTNFSNSSGTDDTETIQLTCHPPFDISSISVEFKGEVSTSSTVTERGFCFGTSPEPTNYNFTVPCGTGTGLFSGKALNLKPNTTYYVRTYAKINGTYHYSTSRIFKTNLEETALPEISTESTYSISASGAIVSALITEKGPYDIQEKGICWGTQPAPTILKNKKSSPGNSLSFSLTLSGLSPGTTYYVRSYARNYAGIAYGNQLVFKTLSTNPQPTEVILDKNYSILNFTSFSFNARVMNGENIKERGICYGISPNPTIFHTKIVRGSGNGQFNALISNLQQFTTYYFRAYAINQSDNVFYSDIISGKTTGIDNSFQLNTQQIQQITENSALFSGTYSTPYDYLEINEMGFCYSQFEEPTLAHSKLKIQPQGNSYPKSFSSSIQGLLDDKKYYVRTYAIIYGGEIQYGNIQSFQTKKGTPNNLPNTVAYNGYNYKTVKIGTQVWFAENLRTSHYRNGDPIPEISNNFSWPNTNVGAFCYFENNASFNEPYGKLYNWYAVMDNRGLCPQGWRIPSDDDWKILERHLGMNEAELNHVSDKRGHYENVGGKLKKTLGWDYENIGATNSTGFTGVPSGGIIGINFIPNIAFYWTSTSRNHLDAWTRMLENWLSAVGRQGFSNRDGFSVRCLKN